MKRNPKHAGELAEIAFMGRAMGMGLIVTQPYGDNARYDFAVDNGKRFKRVQVKSCGALAKGRGSYNVNVGRHTARGAVPYLKSEIHAVAVLIVPEGRWYILPWAALRGRVGLKIPSANAAKGGEFRKYAEAWGLLLGGRRRRLRGGISASGVLRVEPRLVGARSACSR